MGGNFMQSWDIHQAGLQEYNQYFTAVEMFQPKLIFSPKVRRLGRRVISLNDPTNAPNINTLESANYRWVLKPYDLAVRARRRMCVVYRVLCLSGRVSVRALEGFP